MSKKYADMSVAEKAHVRFTRLPGEDVDAIVEGTDDGGKDPDRRKDAIQTVDAAVELFTSWGSVDVLPMGYVYWLTQEALPWLNELAAHLVWVRSGRQSYSGRKSAKVA